MPELPEVETIATYLRLGNNGAPPLVGQVVRFVVLNWRGTLALPGEAEFSARLQGKEVLSIGRRGKFLLINFQPESLLVHLRMSGDLFVSADSEATPQPGLSPTHDRLVIYLTSGHRLIFNDPRKFGRVWLTSEPQSILGGLGPEPLEPDFTPEVFCSLLKTNRRRLKPLLLDQHFIAGLGNIYSDEVLFQARLHPLQIANSLDKETGNRLYRSIQTVLKDAILHHGSSIDWIYRGGDFQNTFQVYQRHGLPCTRCGTLIERIRLNQRSTHYCPSCQALAA